MVNALDVLIVDDNEDDALLAECALAEVGYAPNCWRVDTAKDLDEALNRQRWDVVLCDARMPQLEMPVALTLVRGVAPATPLVLVAGERPRDAEELLADAAFDAVLKKDRVNDLGALVCALLVSGTSLRRLGHSPGAIGAIAAVRAQTD